MVFFISESDWSAFPLVRGIFSFQVEITFNLIILNSFFRLSVQFWKGQFFLQNTTILSISNGFRRQLHYFKMSKYIKIKNHNIFFEDFINNFVNHQIYPQHFSFVNCSTAYMQHLKCSMYLHKYIGMYVISGREQISAVESAHCIFFCLGRHRRVLSIWLFWTQVN